MPYLYGIDLTYIYMVLPFVILSMIVSQRVKSTFQKYETQLNSRHLTGAEAAQRVLMAHGVRDVRVQRVAGELTDHFDPKAKIIRLSEKVYDSTSTAAIGVACHEAGHAVQYNQGYFPMQLRSAVIPVTNIGSKLAVPLILIGLLLPLFSELPFVAEDVSYFLIYLGIGCFSFSLILQLITLPVEFNASRRAMDTIREKELLTREEEQGAKKVLQAAAMTYVAATALALVQILRLLTLFGRKKR